jgi:hypothetical protein
MGVQAVGWLLAVGSVWVRDSVFGIRYSVFGSIWLRA